MPSSCAMYSETLHVGCIAGSLGVDGSTGSSARSVRGLCLATSSACADSAAGSRWRGVVRRRGGWALLQSRRQTAGLSGSLHR